MSREVPSWDDIPETRRSVTVPSGLYMCEVEALEEQTSNAGNLMYKATYNIADGPFKGTPLYEYHNIGNADDPQAHDPLTWRNAIGTRTLRDLMRATGVPMVTNMDKVCLSVKGQRFLQQLETKNEPMKRRDGTDNPFAGKERNELSAKYRVGERPPSPSGGRAAVSEILKRNTTREDE